MKPIHIPDDKHIGILFQPRSGSHVLRSFLCHISDRVDLGECFNHFIPDKSNKITVIGNGLGFGNHNENPPLTQDQMYQRSIGHLRSLTTMSQHQMYAVFSILPRSFTSNYPQLNEMIATRGDIFFIRLERADVLYSILSRITCNQSSIWHNPVDTNGAKALTRIYRKYSFPIDELEMDLRTYIKSSKTISDNYTAPVIYYEQYQSSPGSIRKLFTGIPQMIISSPVGKFAGNYKSHIENLDEVEDFYEQFVNDHKEYFPQYFGKTPCVLIPKSQGRQPRNLSALPA